MPNKVRDDLLVVDATSFPYIVEENITIRLKSFEGIVRCNVYRPKTEAKVPVLVTYGPYGKDIHYREYVALKSTSIRA
jgi:predicted acyl esterase